MSDKDSKDNLISFKHEEIVTTIPHLIIKEQPIQKIRFRYITEVRQTSGSLHGITSTQFKKTYPTVELKGYTKSAVIRCSLYQTDCLQRSQHAHKLIVRNDSDNYQGDPHYVNISNEIGYIAVFQGMSIMHTPKKLLLKELLNKRIQEKTFEFGREANENDLSSIERACKDMDLNKVCLCFEALTKLNDGSYIKICEPIYSETINNLKSVITGNLKISRLSAVVSNASGGDDLMLLVNRVGKTNIKVRFFEIDEQNNDEIIWEDYGKFIPNEDVHHQYAISLKTPPYKNIYINTRVQVFVQLLRPSDYAVSEPIRFMYKPTSFN